MQISSVKTAIKAIRLLGFQQVWLNALYRLGLASGHYRRSIQPPEPIDGLRMRGLFNMPEAEILLNMLGERGRQNLLDEADEIVNGKFRQFGAEVVEINLAPTGPLANWTDYETGKTGLYSDMEDIKLTWEPARFGWTFVLGRAFRVTQDERYADTFWRLFEEFVKANPAYEGPNWTSGQEVGLRLMAWIWAGVVFSGSAASSPERLEKLTSAIAVHAARIPGTLVYARSQNNNHLLTEAAALYSAGLALPDHPKADKWANEGKRWLAWCFQHQIDANGEYVQHSMNYQRLMLQTAVWVWAIRKRENPRSGEGPFDETSRRNLGLATQWLLERLDPVSGQTPNLGANDGALILPLSSCGFEDFRPAAQAASRAFLNISLSGGVWDEMTLWLGLTEDSPVAEGRAQSTGQLYAANSWASLRAVQYHSRPSHADQLHCDLWWRGLNIAQDAGTYSYNATPPWDNRLTSTLIHNTVSVNGEEQMTRAGRFLYLDWVGAEFTGRTGSPVEGHQLIKARTEAYARFDVKHERSLTVFKDETWLVEDELTRRNEANPEPLVIYRLNWLLPDWEWKLEIAETGAVNVALDSPYGWINLTISASRAITRTGLVRAGQMLKGDGLVSPNFGWYSPTYNVKKPALSLAVEVKSAHNVSLKSEFKFPVSG